jgi:hypothetical protein
LVERAENRRAAACTQMARIETSGRKATGRYS